MKQLLAFLLLVVSGSSLTTTLKLYNLSDLDQTVTISTQQDDGEGHNVGGNVFDTFNVPGAPSGGGTVVKTYTENVANYHVLVTQPSSVVPVGNSITEPDPYRAQVDITQGVGVNPGGTYTFDCSDIGGTPAGRKTAWLTDISGSISGVVYAEGVDKIVYAINAGNRQAASSAGGTGGGGEADPNQTAFYAEHARLSSDVNNAKTDGNAIYAGLGAADEAATKKEAIEAAMGARDLPNTGSVPTVSRPSILDITLPFLPGSLTLHLDPASNSHVAVLAAFMKVVIAWTVAILFQVFLWNYFKEAYLALAGSPVAKGNPVFGGSAAQGTSLLVATAITGVLLSFPVSFWALADSGYGWGTTILAGNNPLEAANAGPDYLQIAAYLFTYFVPVGTLLSALSSYFLVLRGGLVLLAGVQTLVRYFVF